jgi:hypothetical protein
MLLLVAPAHRENGSPEFFYSPGNVYRSLVAVHTLWGKASASLMPSAIRSEPRMGCREPYGLNDFSYYKLFDAS